MDLVTKLSKRIEQLMMENEELKTAGIALEMRLGDTENQLKQDEHKLKQEYHKHAILASKNEMLEHALYDLQKKVCNFGKFMPQDKWQYIMGEETGND